MTVDDPTRRLFARVFGMVPMRTAHGLAAFERGLASMEPGVVVVEKELVPAAAPVGSLRTEAAGTLPATLLRDHAERELRRIASAFLLVDPAEVALTDDLMEIGFDSISLTELVNEVNETFGLELLPTAVFESATLGGFAGYLVTNHGEAVARAAGRGRARRSRQEARKPESDGESRPLVRESTETAVAIIGMAGVFPGSPDLDAFWQHLAAGKDLTGPVPPDRLELLAHPDTARARAGFVTDVADFDAARFRVSAAEAMLMDPQQRLFLQAAWRAIEDAGYQPGELAGQRHRPVRRRVHHRLRRSAAGARTAGPGAHRERYRALHSRQPGLACVRPARPERGGGHRVLERAGGAAPRGALAGRGRLLGRPRRRRQRAAQPGAVHSIRPVRDAQPGRSVQDVRREGGRIRARRGRGRAAAQAAGRSSRGRRPGATR